MADCHDSHPGVRPGEQAAAPAATVATTAVVRAAMAAGCGSSGSSGSGSSGRQRWQHYRAAVPSDVAVRAPWRHDVISCCGQGARWLLPVFILSMALHPPSEAILTFCCKLTVALPLPWCCLQAGAAVSRAFSACELVSAHILTHIHKVCITFTSSPHAFSHHKSCNHTPLHIVRAGGHADLLGIRMQHQKLASVCSAGSCISATSCGYLLHS